MKSDKTADTGKLLEQWLGAGDQARWLSEHPESRAALAPYAELESRLRQARPDSSFPPARWQARERLLATLEQPPQAPFREASSPVLRVAAVAAALALFAAATVGAGAFFAGVNPIEEALEAVHLDGEGDGEETGGINNAPDAADNGREHANDNAFEGSDNSHDGINNASEKAETGREHASDNASEGGGNSDNGPGPEPTPGASTADEKSSGKAKPGGPTN